MGDRNARDMHRKRLAIQLMAQLPDDPEEATLVISYMKELLIDFIQRDETARASNQVRPLRLVSETTS